MTATIVTLARDMAAAMITAKRDNGDRFYKIAPGSPEWMKDVCMAAHDGGNVLPDDYRYAFIADALGNIEQADDDATLEDLTDMICEWSDGDTDVYNSDLYSWLQSSVHRAGYVDEHTNECGHSDMGLSGDIMGGQCGERREVYYQIIDALDALV